MTIDRSEGDVVTVVLRGEHDVATAGPFRDRLTEIIESGSPVVVALGLVSFLDSTMLGALLGGLRRARERDQGFALVIEPDTEPAVRRVFELTGLFRAFPVYGSREEALGALRDPATAHR